jgi:hypothetical protein
VLAVLMTAAMRASVGSIARILFGRGHHDQPVAIGYPSFASALTSARVISGVKRWLNSYS